MRQNFKRLVLVFAAAMVSQNFALAAEVAAPEAVPAPEVAPSLVKEQAPVPVLPVLAENAVGVVSFAEGQIGIQRGAGFGIDILKSDDLIDAGDTVLCSDGAYVTLNFADGSTVTLSGEGRFEVREYIFNAKAPEKGRARFAAPGTNFRYKSGLMGKDAKPDVQIVLDYGTIFIRAGGSEFMRVLKNGESLFYLRKGKIRVKNKRGSVYLTEGQGTSISARNVAPASPKLWSADQAAWIMGAVSVPGGAVGPQQVQEEEVSEESAPEASISEMPVSEMPAEAVTLPVVEQVAPIVVEEEKAPAVEAVPATGLEPDIVDAAPKEEAAPVPEEIIRKAAPSAIPAAPQEAVDAPDDAAKTKKAKQPHKPKPVKTKVAPQAPAETVPDSEVVADPPATAQ